MSPIKSLIKPNPSYRWYILAASFGILFFTTGTRFSFGVMFKPMIAEFGWDRGSLSLAFFLNMTIFALSLTVDRKQYPPFLFGIRFILPYPAAAASRGQNAIAWWPISACSFQ